MNDTHAVLPGCLQFISKDMSVNQKDWDCNIPEHRLVRESPGLRHNRSTLAASNHRCFGPACSVCCSSVLRLATGGALRLDPLGLRFPQVLKTKGERLNGGTKEHCI